MAQNIWEVGQDAFLRSLAEREARRILEEDRERRMRFEDMAEARAQAAEGRASAFHPHQVEGQRISNLSAQQGMAQRAALFPVQLNNALLDTASTTQGIEQAADLHPINVAAGQAGLANTLSQIERAAELHPLNVRNLESSIASRDAQTARLNSPQPKTGLPTPVMNLAATVLAQPGMDRETALRWVRVNLPQIQQTYGTDAVDPGALVDYVTSAFDRPQQSSALDAVLAGDQATGPVFSDDQLRALGPQVPSAAPTTAQPQQATISDVIARVQADGRPLTPENVLFMANLMQVPVPEGLFEQGPVAPSRRSGLTPRQSSGGPQGPVAGRGARTVQLFGEPTQARGPRGRSPR